ncbi:MAG: hypothetical protein U0Y82_14590 [Thermoleophilia bacterium]
MTHPAPPDEGGEAPCYAHLFPAFGPARPALLFVCPDDAGLALMAARFAVLLCAGRVEARSAGIAPAGAVRPDAVDAMAEVGLDLSCAPARCVRRGDAHHGGRGGVHGLHPARRGTHRREVLVRDPAPPDDADATATGVVRDRAGAGSRPARLVDVRVVHVFDRPPSAGGRRRTDGRAPAYRRGAAAASARLLTSTMARSSWR